jgi:hypothetical protein
MTKPIKPNEVPIVPEAHYEPYIQRVNDILSQPWRKGETRRIIQDVKTFGPIYADQQIVMEYFRAAGWTLKVESDQRDCTDWVEITRPGR